MKIQVNIRKGTLGDLCYGELNFQCALGKSGTTLNKREGDNASPIGDFVLRALYYRPDKMPPPDCALQTFEIDGKSGWCDDPAHEMYNKKVSLPFGASHELLKRDDDLYDLVVILGHNDNPPVPGKGSCIFMHVAKPGYTGTEGCIALKKEDLLTLLGIIDCETVLSICG